MGVGQIVDDAAVSHLHGLVSVVNVGSHFIGCLLQFLHRLLLSLVRIDHVSDVASLHEDTQQLAVLVAHRVNHHFVVYEALQTNVRVLFPLFLQSVHVYDARAGHGVQCVQVNVSKAGYFRDVLVGIQHALFVFDMEGLHGLVVNIGEDAVLVVEYHVND